MDTEAIQACPKCGVYYDKDICQTKKQKTMYGNVVESAEYKCPCCKTEHIEGMFGLRIK